MEEQRSKEWFQKRKGKITGSAVGAILGLNPYTKKEDVLRRMVREYHGYPSEFTGNIATDYGTNNESNAIGSFELNYDLSVTETGFHVHPVYDWLGASPDGLVGDSSIIEIKCPFSRRKDALFKSIDEQPHYYAQVQIELYCTERKSAFFLQWSPYGYKLEMVDIDEKWIDENVPKLYDFYELFLSELDNPEHLTDLSNEKTQEIDNDESKELITMFLSFNEELKRIRDAVDHCREKIIELANGKKSIISGVSVTPSIRKGTINYKKIVEENLTDIDLSKYQSKSTTTWTIK